MKETSLPPKNTNNGACDKPSFWSCQQGSGSDGRHFHTGLAYWDNAWDNSWPGPFDSPPPTQAPVTNPNRLEDGVNFTLSTAYRPGQCMTVETAMDGNSNAVMRQCRNLLNQQFHWDGNLIRGQEGECLVATDNSTLPYGPQPLPDVRFSNPCNASDSNAHWHFMDDTRKIISLGDNTLPDTCLFHHDDFNVMIWPCVETLTSIYWNVNPV